MKIVWTNPDGGMTVYSPAYNDFVSGKTEAETETEYLDRVALRAVPADATNVQYVEDSTIPTDRSKRDAWEQNGKTIQVNATKAALIK